MTQTKRRSLMAFWERLDQFMIQWVSAYGTLLLRPALVGLGLLLGIALRLTLFLLFAQMAGTFLVLLVRPEIAFLGSNPLLLSVEGEFVVKNLVLIAAGVVIGGSVRREARQGKR